MTNIYFPEEKVTVNDLYFVCYMVERIARQLQHVGSVVVTCRSQSTGSITVLHGPSCSTACGIFLA